MEVFQVNKVLSGVRGRVTTILAHIQLVPALLVGVMEVEPVDFAPVWLKWAALGERLPASHALVWTDTCLKSSKLISELSILSKDCNFIDGNRIVIFNTVLYDYKCTQKCWKEIWILYKFYKMTNLTCMCSCVSFEIKGIVKTFATYRTKVSLDFTVAFQVTVK